MLPSLSVALAVVCMTSLWSSVDSHGRLWTPPGRATMWRRGFNTPKNYNDNQMFCGGLSHQQSLGYKCGLCGDPYDSKRPHEAPNGKYATGTIAANYTQGEEVVLEVDLTANHKGWFEFKLCPTNDNDKRATQSCLDQYPLQLSDGSGTKLDVSDKGSNMISIPVVLPPDLTCDLCMLQWHYHGGNNWGTAYSAQEEFYGCADVKIKPKDGSHPKINVAKPTQSPKPDTAKPAMKPTPQHILNLTTRKRVPSPAAAVSTPAPTHAQRAGTGSPHCKSIGPWVPGIEVWCELNCKDPNACPTERCECQYY